MSADRLDPRAALLRAKANTGLAPRNVVSKILPGAVFHADDSAIVFPDERVEGNRSLHRRRRVIVMQCVEDCRSSRPRSVLVIPCTASAKGPASHYEYELPSGESGFSADRVVACLHLIQPILKSELGTLGEWAGFLRPATMAALQARLASTLALVPEPAELPLPPRVD